MPPSVLIDRHGTPCPKCGVASGKRAHVFGEVSVAPHCPHCGVDFDESTSPAPSAGRMHERERKPYQPNEISRDFHQGGDSPDTA